MMKKKATVAVAALALVLCFAIGGTLAWLKDISSPVVNTFTYGDINIDLSESNNLDLKMVPGNDIIKDPKVTVEADSEACWLFVKVEKSANYGDYLADYAIANGWTALPGADGVYYREVNAETAKTGASYSVLADNKVTVLSNVTKSMMEDIKNGNVNAPTLTFTAYAVQKDGFDTAVDAWNEATK